MGAKPLAHPRWRPNPSVIKLFRTAGCQVRLRQDPANSDLRPFPPTRLRKPLPGSPRPAHSRPPPCDPRADRAAGAQSGRSQRLSLHQYIRTSESDGDSAEAPRSTEGKEKQPSEAVSILVSRESGLHTTGENHASPGTPVPAPGEALRWPRRLEGRLESSVGRNFADSVSEPESDCTQHGVPREVGKSGQPQPRDPRL